ncbi:hypothetical protein C1H46_037458 [Malus baccata]|uniref:Germin-like protein n=1 Tax=Malus baccata TaxID=106549 RepID=A0A540KSM3_MALBA|nr:hypothetical protein C1H46_037458 [Malus baccata]
MAAVFALFIVALATVLGSSAADPDMLQDICVADYAAGNSLFFFVINSLSIFPVFQYSTAKSVKVNGFVCKDAANATAEDFFSAGLAKPGLTNNTFGSLVTAANVQKIPGLNTLGVSLARIDYAPGGINPPHTHPRATEIVYVLEGVLDVGFITTANKLISKTIKKGEVFVFPKGLVHFQNNNGKGPASVIAGFNSQLQGTVNIALTLFAATPEVPDHVLTKTFQVGTKEVKKIKSRLAPKA